MNFNLSNDLINLAKIVSNKAQLYIVGGFVRNRLLKRKPNDIDLTSCLTIEELEGVLNDSNYTIKVKNEKLGTATITFKETSYEYATFRKELYSKNGSHFPKKIEFVKNLEEDMLRRDFTINALYLNILTNQICGIEIGKSDVKRHVLRQVNSSTLSYDGERILRMIKYAVKFNLKIEKQTLKQAQKNYKNVYDLNSSMLKSYKQFFKNLSLFKKLRAKFLIKKLNLTNIFKNV